mgnify:CR=1 FL=1
MKKEIQLISDFNLSLFFNYLNNKIDKKKYKLNKPNYELFVSSCYKTINSSKKNHLIFVWNRVEETLNEFSNLINCENFSPTKLKKEIKKYTDLLIELSKKTDHLLVTSWTLPHLYRGEYLKDWTSEKGLSKNLNIINSEVGEKLKKKSNIHFFNVDFFFQNNFESFNPKLWYATKTPYNNKIFETAAEELNQIIQSFSVPSRKLLILDLDNTLWGGIVGEIGWKNVNLGGHDYTGEAYVDFQKKIKILKKKGIQLAIISKNDEKNALDVFEKNKQMVLSLKDFTAWRINWNDKAKNLLEITKELNLSTDSCVFIDDNVNERNRIKTSLPDVLVPDWPDDPSFYSNALLKLNCFYSRGITKEDNLRTKFYKDEKKRETTKTLFESHSDWLKSLSIKITSKNIDSVNKTRSLQLINKTNQMNLITRRLTEEQIDKIMNDKNKMIKTFSVSDKLGDMGLIGLYTIEHTKKGINVLDFILSCRAFGRSIENYMAQTIIQLAKKKRVRNIKFNYLKTKKNNPALIFLNSLKLKKINNKSFIYNNYKIDVPKHLNIK